MYLNRKLRTATKKLRYLWRYTTIPSSHNGAKKHLVVITGELEVGGVGRVLLNIIQGIPSDEFRITIITTDPRLNNWAPEFSKHGVQIIDIPLIIGRSLAQNYVEYYLQRYLRKNGADIIFITNSLAAYKSLPGIRKQGQSKDAKIYDLLHTHGRPEDNDAFLRTSMPYDKYIDRRIVISNYLRDYFCEHYPVDPNKVRVIYNGIDKPLLQYTPDMKLGKDFLKIKASERAITYLGRLQDDKSPIRLVEIAYQLRGELAAKEMFIAIVGEGELHTSLKERAKSLGILDKQVRLYPFTTHPLDISSASYFTILTSDLEGIPMSTLESMLMRVPSIAPAVGGIPEIIDDGKNGFLATFVNVTEEDHLQSLINATKRAIDTPLRERDQMGESAQNKILERFGSMSADYLELFRQE